MAMFSIEKKGSMTRKRFRISGIGDIRYVFGRGQGDHTFSGASDQ